MSETEKIRKDFKPDRIMTLFVGESGPASGRFFYYGNSTLYRAMERVLGNRETFFDDFKRKGFYLDDLVLTPINKLERRERSRLRQQAIPKLAKRLIEYKPKAVVVVMRAIQPMVREAMNVAGISYEPYCVPHPAFGNWNRFCNEMTEIIDSLPTVGGSKQKDRLRDH